MNSKPTKKSQPSKKPVFTVVTVSMTREQKIANLTDALKKSGFNVIDDRPKSSTQPEASESLKMGMSSREARQRVAKVAKLMNSRIAQENPEDS